jgi:Amt family ammonium transporter
MAGTICNFGTQLKYSLDRDDALDVRSHLHQVLTFHEKIFASHGTGGIVGNFITALFAQKSIAAAIAL